ncbi:hypothetical protein J7382_18420 [Shimia sp. R11_0]|uniref:hypothetical protein n=1 Tax=Shimia sp. R11_0 TaxID=2821096 RepID=UPI001ADC0EE3|nr:hypothetical protein [Shimia sp. R11_0]MBO9479525.1 hypothetical protein [Shimia sp. R11_0]
MRFSTAAALALIAAPAYANGHWTFDAWQVYTETVSAGNYLHLSCTAYSGGNGDPLVRISITNSEVGPPANYPTVYVQENAPRGYATNMQQGHTVALVIDDRRDFYAHAYNYYDNDGILQAYAGISDPDSLATMRAMRTGQMMSVYLDGVPYTHVNLSGFTAAYVKAMDACGHSGSGVVN